jgi:hypothetical protein
MTGGNNHSRIIDWNSYEEFEFLCNCLRYAIGNKRTDGMGYLNMTP